MQYKKGAWPPKGKKPKFYKLLPIADQIKSNELLTKWKSYTLAQRCIFIQRDFDIKVSADHLGKYYLSSGIKPY